MYACRQTLKNSNAKQLVLNVTSCMYKLLIKIQTSYPTPVDPLVMYGAGSWLKPHVLAVTR